MMTEVQKRQRSLLSFQQAIGGSLAKSVHMADNDFDPDDDPLTVSKSCSIRVPTLEEIVIPQDLAEQQRPSTQVPLTLLTTQEPSNLPSI